MQGSDNDKIKHIYGNYNFWSWLRYWYLDSANYITLLLLDKGYYDYDYKTENHDVDKPKRKKVVHDLDTMPDISYDDTQRMLAEYNLGIYAKPKQTATPEMKQTLSAEELQAKAMAELNK